MPKETFFFIQITKNKSTNIKYLLKQKLAAESTGNQSFNAHYSSFISLLSLQDDIGYLVIEGPSFDPIFSPNRYIYQVYMGLGGSVLIFLSCFYYGQGLLHGTLSRLKRESTGL